MSWLTSLSRLFRPQPFEMPEERECDKYGCGHYGASRAGRKHKGIDFIYHHSEPVRAFKGGKVTKLGYPYADDLSFRYVQISDNGADMRYFYVCPTVRIGQKVKRGDIIGFAQAIELRYPGITPHIHFEVKADGLYMNPRRYAE